MGGVSSVSESGWAVTAVSWMGSVWLLGGLVEVGWERIWGIITWDLLSESRCPNACTIRSMIVIVYITSFYMAKAVEWLPQETPFALAVVN